MYYSVITDRYKCIKLNDLEKIKMNHVFFFWWICLIKHCTLIFDARKIIWFEFFQDIYNIKWFYHLEQRKEWNNQMESDGEWNLLEENDGWEAGRLCEITCSSRLISCSRSWILEAPRSCCRWKTRRLVGSKTCSSFAFRSLFIAANLQKCSSLNFSLLLRFSWGKWWSGASDVLFHLLS